MSGFVDVDLGARISTTLLALLTECDRLDGDGRVALRGGVDYFLLTVDGDNDLDEPG